MADSLGLPEGEGKDGPVDPDGPGNTVATRPTGQPGDSPGGGRRRLMVPLSVMLAAVLAAVVLIRPDPAGQPPGEPSAAAAAAPLGEGYRLRVAGLHPLVSESPGESARLEIGAAVDPAGGWALEARLVSEDSGRVLWAADYHSTGTDPADLRETVNRALTEAMRLTREGVGAEAVRL